MVNIVAAKMVVGLMRSVAPVAILYHVLKLLIRARRVKQRLRVFGWGRIKLSLAWKMLEAWLLVEGAFYILCILLNRKFQALTEPPKFGKPFREALVSRVIRSWDEEKTSSLSKWFYGTPLDRIHYTNLVQFIKWGLFSRHYDEEFDLELQTELDSYVKTFQEHTNCLAPEGYDPDVKFMRPSVESFDYCHRPLTYYAVMHIIVGNIVERVALWKLGFHYRTGKAHRLCYWYRLAAPEYKEAAPFVFVHGVGIGMLPYLMLLRELVDNKRDVFLIQVPHISNRISTFVPGRDDVIESVKQMLESHNHATANFMGHSFGCVYVSWIVKYCSNIVSSVVLFDPIVFLFNSADTVKGFLYSEPPRSCGKSHLVDYFIRQDLFIKYTFYRHFWWHEAALWKEDLKHPTLVIVSEDDNIVPSPAIAAYLSSNKYIDLTHLPLKILSFEKTQHGGALWISERRKQIAVAAKDIMV